MIAKLKAWALWALFGIGAILFALVKGRRDGRALAHHDRAGGHPDRSDSAAHLEPQPGGSPALRVDWPEIVSIGPGRFGAAAIVRLLLNLVTTTARGRQ